MRAAGDPDGYGHDDEIGETVMGVFLVVLVVFVIIVVGDQRAEDACRRARWHSPEIKDLDE